MTTWGVQLNTLESRASEHEQFASALISNLADPLKGLAARYEELRKYHADYAVKLEKERDSTYADLRKQKGKYDSACQEVENRRKKIDSSFDHGKQKARNAFEQQQVEITEMMSSGLPLTLALSRICVGVGASNAANSEGPPLTTLCPLNPTVSNLPSAAPRWPYPCPSAEMRCLFGAIGGHAECISPFGRRMRFQCQRARISQNSQEKRREMAMHWYIVS